MKRPALSGYLLSYLVTVMLSLIVFLTENMESITKAVERGEEPRNLGRVVETVVACLLLALFSIPVRMLLGLFPEASPHTLVRMVRRMVLGALCGPVPLLLVCILIGKGGKPEEVLGMGFILGALIGLVDSIVWDQRLAGRSLNEEPLPR